jgi:hypothetical protein
MIYQERWIVQAIDPEPGQVAAVLLTVSFEFTWLKYNIARPFIEATAEGDIRNFFETYSIFADRELAKRLQSNEKASLDEFSSPEFSVNEGEKLSELTNGISDSLPELRELGPLGEIWS